MRNTADPYDTTTELSLINSCTRKRTYLAQYKHRVQTAKRQYHTQEFLQDNLLSVKYKDDEL